MRVSGWDKPQFYNAPLSRSYIGALTGGVPWTMIDPVENPKGLFLDSIVGFAGIGTNAQVGLNVYVGRTAPDAYAPSGEKSLELLAVALALVQRFDPATGLPVILAATLDYRPRVPRFIQPGYGVWIIAPATSGASQTYISGFFFPDVEQAGR